MMSMRVTQGKDYFDPSDGGNFWRRRTGLEQKLIIVSSILFCLAFALMITTIVLDKRLENYKSKSSDTTPGPTTDSTLTTTTTTAENGTTTAGNDTTTVGNDTTTAGNDTTTAGNDTTNTTTAGNDTTTRK
ncbi:endochitinase A-like [Centruroides sculpturatus]|uniref:endochitinase A-like n=1 Tax=Centruroides sculpturatus TaxID=218467 RepID=UPI000C6CFEFB|nr:endochitinase A-like [Centruroides sculpturatus]